MKVICNSSFKELAENVNSHIQINLASLGTGFNITDQPTLLDSSILNTFKESMTTLDELPIQGLIDQDTNKIHFFLDCSSINNIKEVSSVFIYYTNLLDNSNGIAFILYNLGEGLKIGNNLIKIGGLNWKSKVEFYQNNNIEILESYGEGSYSSIYIEDNKFTEKESYRNYLDYIKGLDDLNHLSTTFINNFGIRIY